MRLFNRFLLSPEGGEGNGNEENPPGSSPASDQGGSQPQVGGDKPAGDSNSDDLSAPSSSAGEKPNVFDESSHLLNAEGAEGSPLPDGGQDGKASDAAAKDGQAAAQAKPGPVLSQDSEAQFAKAFDERPEWKSLNTLLGDKAKEAKPFLRQLFQRETQLGQQVETLKVPAQLGERVRRALSDGSPEENRVAAENAVALVEMWREGRPEAVTMLENLLADVKGRIGLTLSSPDLVERARKIDEQVDSVRMTPEEGQQRKADLLEIEKSRAGQKRAEGQQKQTERQQVQARNEQLIADRTTALNEWEKLGPSKNPDYANEKTGLRMRVIREAQLLVGEREAQTGRLLSPQELVEVAKQAYEEVMTFAGGLLPKAREERVPLTGSSSGKAIASPRTYQEALDSAAAIL